MYRNSHYQPWQQPGGCPTCGHCPTCGRGGVIGTQPYWVSNTPNTTQFKFTPEQSGQITALKEHLYGNQITAEDERFTR